MSKIPIMHAGSYIRVKNLEKYQHYTHRNPPWIKLHVSILESYEFGQLPDNAKWHALGILLLVSKIGNSLPADPGWIQQRTQSSTKPSLELLISCGFVEQDASKMLATCQQNGVTETETETEERQRQSRGEVTKIESVGASKNGETPERWKDLADELKSSSHLNRAALFDWHWWEKIDRIYESNNDLDFLVEIRKMDEWVGRKRVNGLKKDWKRFVANWLANAGGQ